MRSLEILVQRQGGALRTIQPRADFHLPVQMARWPRSFKSAEIAPTSGRLQAGAETGTRPSPRSAAEDHFSD